MKMYYGEEFANYAANKALRKLGIRNEQKTLSYDGKQVGKDILEWGTPCVKVSDEPIDISNLQSITISNKDGTTTNYDKSQFIYGNDSGILYLAVDRIQFYPVFVIPNESAAEEYGTNAEVGTYFYSSANSYTSKIAFPETTTPISDKYLPGVCLPVVELETVASPDGIGVALTEEDSAKMDALDGGLCILCLSISGEITDKACAITALDAADSMKVYSASTFLSDITVSNGGGHWTVVCTPKEV